MNDIREHFTNNGQGHVFTFFDELSEEEKESLTQQASDIDLEELKNLVSTLVQSPGAGNEAIADSLEPADFTPLPDAGGNPTEWIEAREKGEAALRAGRVAAFTVAGGQGTRLGYDGPKGTFGVTPVMKNSLFQVFAEKILASSRIFGRPIPWFILTSIINHEETVKFFERNDYFGLSKEKIHFFSQGLMPAVDNEGKILLADKGQMALSPDGHGGALRALVRSGAIRQMEADGIDTISYFQVDNPLVRCIDPAFIGFHLMSNSELSSKMVPKAYPEEKVGVFCQSDGISKVVEYSDLPDR
ncbi:MAG: UTP--glucose-1-phosphate uridylyltransferase, partial [Verrucomicrobiota bacterium]